MRRVPVQSGILETGDHVLEPEAAHYIRQVLRLGPGAELELFDGSGRAARGRISGLCRDDVQVTIEEVFAVSPARPRIALFQCIPKGDRWEHVIEKSTELGVSEIVPVMSRRTVVQIPARKAERKHERWRRIALAASRQSGRYHAPQVTEALDFGSAVERDSSALKLVGDPLTPRGELETRLGASGDSISIWIGPEGGFTDDELDSLKSHGCEPLFLSEQTLRSETAGIFAVGLLRYLAGGSA